MSWNVAGKVCVVTGATAGIGRETALGLARLGARVVVVARDQARAAAVSRECAELSGQTVEPCVGELSLVSDVKRVGGALLDAHPRIDVLVNNAGGMFTHQEITAEGFERTWALDHLAYAALSLALLPRLLESGPARIVNVSSQMHRQGAIAFEDTTLGTRYSALRGYGQAKLANVLFTYALARRLDPARVTVNCLHPGIVASDIGKTMDGFVGWWMRELLTRRMGISTADGAKTSVYLASAPEVSGVTGKYFNKCKVFASSRPSHDEALQERLWALTLAHVGMPEPAR